MGAAAVTGFFTFEELSVLAHLRRQQQEVAGARLSGVEQSLLPSDREWERVFSANTTEDWRGYLAQLRRATLVFQTDDRICLTFRACLDNLKSPISARLDGVNDIPVFGKDLEKIVPPLNEAIAHAEALARLQSEIEGLRLENAQQRALIEELRRQLEAERTRIGNAVSIFSNNQIFSGWKNVTISIGDGFVEAILGLLHIDEIRRGLGKVLTSVASTGKTYFSRLARWAEQNAIAVTERGAREKTGAYVRLEEQLRLPQPIESEHAEAAGDADDPPFDLVEAYRLILDGQAPPASWRPRIGDLRFDFESWKIYKSGFPEALAPFTEKAKALSDLSPLAGLTALQTLDLSETGVTDVSPLAGLTALKTLHLSETGVTDLSPLAGLTALESLDFRETGVTDLSPLAGLTVLEILSLNGTSVTDLSPLSGLTALEWLDLDGTGVTDLSPLSGLTTLQTLDLRGTGVTDLSPLAGLTALKTLSLWRTGVTDLSPLSGLTALVRLDLDGTGVTDLSPLSELTVLEILSLNGTSVMDLTPLAGLTALQTLWIDDDVDVTPLTHLAKLAINDRTRGTLRIAGRPKPRKK